MKKILLALSILIGSSPSYLFAQDASTILVLSNKSGKLIFDGEEKGNCEANIPFKVVSTPGEHYVQVRTIENGNIEDKGDVVVLEPAKQKVFKITFDESSSPPATSMEIVVADLNFSIPGLTTVGSWANANPGQSYPYPTHFVAFEKGDEIIVNTSMTNKKGTNVMEVRTYPGNVLKYSNNSFTDLENLRIKVEERSIYQLVFATNHIFDRNCLLTIKRKPASADAGSFNTNVSLQRVSRTISVVESASQFINSGSNAAFKGGTSRIVVPVNLPPNTVEWFYRFSASRSKEEIENTRKGVSLFTELTKLLLDATGVGMVVTKAVSIGIEQLTMPPGSDYCDIYLLTYDNISNFEAKNDDLVKYILEGSRQNLMSGNVKVTCCNQGQFYLGVKNPSPVDGIHVSIEVIAITATDEYVMENR